MAKAKKTQKTQTPKPEVANLQPRQESPGKLEAYRAWMANKGKISPRGIRTAPGSGPHHRRWNRQRLALSLGAWPKSAQGCRIGRKAQGR